MRFHRTSEGRVQYTAAEELARDAEEVQAAIDRGASDAREALKTSKLTGIEILGVMCSAADEDQQGMIAIGFGHLKTGAAFKPTKMKFKNGNELVINVDNIAAVEAIWLPFRQSFFTVEA